MLAVPLKGIYYGRKLKTFRKIGKIRKVLVVRPTAAKEISQTTMYGLFYQLAWQK